MELLHCHDMCLEHSVLVGGDVVASMKVINGDLPEISPATVGRCFCATSKLTLSVRHCEQHILQPLLCLLANTVAVSSITPFTLLLLRRLLTHQRNIARRCHGS